MFFHEPVLVTEIIRWLNLKSDHGIYCDCTAGGAGHLLAMLEQTRTSRFVGIDWDPEAISYARTVIKPYEERCFLFENNFTNLGLILDELDIRFVDGILFDLGASYHQLTTPARGFSFDRDGALLMRMSSQAPTLLDKLKNATKDEIIQVLRDYGEVRNYRRIGTAIFETRNVLATTFDLRELIEKMVPRKYLKRNLHKVFQALRIWTNDELINLKIAVLGALARLNRGGRILVISYHSGEDRIIKNLFRDHHKNDWLKILNKKVIRPSEDEIKRNPRSRSAKLRIGERCGA